jgi:mannosyl-3-phosphoglycerate phosphatase
MRETPSSVPLVVFANLDSVLFERGGLPPDSAGQAVAALAVHRVPLVLCSSRTRAEIELVQHKLGLHHPFLSEHGSAVYIPPGYFAQAPSQAVVRSGYHVVQTGVPYRDVVSTLHRLARQLRVGIESFCQMSVEDVGRAYGLSLLDARLAKLRDHAEPFRFTDATPKARARLLHALQSAGFQCLHDGRFHHAMARVDVGGRARLVRALYAESRPVVAAGVSDRLEDLPLLKEMDVSVVVQGAAGRSTAELFRALPHTVLTVASGHAAWTEAMTSLVHRFIARGASERPAA